MRHKVKAVVLAVAIGSPRLGKEWRELQRRFCNREIRSRHDEAIEVIKRGGDSWRCSVWYLK